jgi:predicted Zn-dependent protease
MRRGLVLLPALCSAISGQDAFTPAKEAALGEQMSRSIRAQARIVQDPAVRGYVSRLATRLAGPNVLLTLDVTDDDQNLTHEPLWLPGGYVFVSGALIRTARDESEFAGMFAHALAHEIGHDTARMSADAIAPVFVAGSPLPQALAARRRPFELEADALAVRMTAAVGYDPEAFARYISRVDAADTERIAALRKAIRELPAQEVAVIDSSEFQRVRERLMPGAQGMPPTLVHAGER